MGTTIKLYKPSKWLKRQRKKAPRYFCLNCMSLFRTGKFSRFDSRYYDDVCPHCGGIGSDLTETAEAYKELVKELQDESKR